MVQLSHPYTTAEKTIALTRQTLVGKVMSGTDTRVGSWAPHLLSHRTRVSSSICVSVSLLVRWGRYWISTGAKSLKSEWQLMKESECCSHAAATVIAHGRGQAAGPQGVKQTQRFHSRARTKRHEHMFRRVCPGDMDTCDSSQ